MDTITFIVISVFVLLIMLVTGYRTRNRRFVAKCGHHCYERDDLSVVKGGVRVLKKIRLKRNPDVPDFCGDCLQSAVIPCAVCGDSILPHDMITIASDTMVPKKGAIVHISDNECVPLENYSKGKRLPVDTEFVACVRKECNITTAMDMYGYWTPESNVFHEPLVVV